MKAHTTTGKDEQQGEKRDVRLKTVTAQFWEDDLEQLNQLVKSRNREQIAFMRRRALHIGTLMLLAEQGIPINLHQQGSIIVGMFTVEELATELLPDLTPAIQNLERAGIQVMPLPASLHALLELMARAGPSGGAASNGTRGASLPQAELAAAALSASATGGEQEESPRGRVRASKEALRRRGIEADGNL